MEKQHGSSRRSAAAGTILLLLGLLANSHALTLDKFEGASAPAPWFFSNGPEFPGATGTFTRGVGHTGAGAHLTYDISAGGKYVAAYYVLPTPTDAGAIQLWVKSPGGVSVQIRVNDSTGQTLQYSPSRPLEAVDAGQWYRLLVKFVPTTDHFGGSVNDGVLHGPITEVGVLAQPDTTKTGAIDFDSVKLVDAPSTPIDPTTTPATVPATSQLSASLGVEITHADATPTGLGLAQSLGFSFISTEMFWSDVETTVGVYDFTYYDQLFADLKARGLRAQFILCYGNSLYTGPEFLNPPRTPAAVQAFANFAGAAAARYAGQGVRFEVWNEPNLSGFWNPPNALEYSNLYEATAAQLHLGDPSAFVITGGLAGIDLTYLDAMIGPGGITAADAIGVHPYRLEAPEQLVGDLLDLRAHVAQGFPGDTPPIWSTESGYSSAWYGDGSAADNRTKQAKYCVRQMLTGLALGLPSQTFFDLRDTGSDTTAAEENFGIVDSAYQPKPLTAAVQTLLQQCKGRTFAGILPSSQSDVHILKFESTDDTLLVIWSESPTGAAQRVFFSKQPVQVLDYLGNPVTLVTQGAKRRSVKIKDAPVYITFPGNL